MSIASDAKSYAGIAVEQGKQVISQAQTLAGQAYTELRAKGDELLASARQHEVKLPGGLDAEAIKARLAPLVTQAMVIGEAVTEKADELRKDHRMAKAVSSAESVANSVHQHLVQPVLARAGFTSPPAEAANKPTGTRPAQTRPAQSKPAQSKPAQTKPAQTKPAQTKPAQTKPASAAAAGPTLHAVKPTKASARAPRKTSSPRLADPARESE
jgi:hypothetical protein